MEENPNDTVSIESGEIKEINHSKKHTRRRSRSRSINSEQKRDSSVETIKGTSNNIADQEEIIVYEEGKETNMNNNTFEIPNKIKRKDRIRQILENAKVKISNKESLGSSMNNKSKNKIFYNPHSSLQKNENENSMKSKELLEFISNQRDILEKDGIKIFFSFALENKKCSSISSTPDIFSDDFKTISNNMTEQNDKISNIDLGISNKYETVGYYTPQLGEIINKRYKVVGLCGKGIFSSVVKVVDITSNIGYALKIIRDIDIMRASGEKERNIISSLNKGDKEGISHNIKFLR